VAATDEVEQRNYRPTYDATQNYSKHHECYYAEAYWRSLADANLGHTPAAGSLYWEECTVDMVPYIAFDQPWEASIIDETGVDWERCIYDYDPTMYPDKPAVPGCRAWEQSILVPIEEAPLQPYVRFRPVRPKISFVLWAVGTAYATGAVRFLMATGESYVALRPNTGASPDASVEDWAPVKVPEMFADYIRMFVRAERSADDEGRYKMQAQAENELDRLRDTYMRISGDRTARKVRWRSGR